MSPEDRGIFRKSWTFLLNIGADPADDEFTRTIKRIWWPVAATGVLASLGGTLSSRRAAGPPFRSGAQG